MTESHVVFLSRSFETIAQRASQTTRDSQSPYTPTLLHVAEAEDWKQITYRIDERRVAIFTYVDGMRTARIEERRAVNHVEHNLPEMPPTPSQRTV